MKDTENALKQDELAVGLGRHKAQCSVCKHPDREEIEREWVGWGNTTVIADVYELTRDSLYRHAHALDLFRKRQKNLKGAYEKIIERLDIASVSGSTILAALKAYATLCAHEEKNQGKDLPTQQPAHDGPEPESEGIRGDCSFPELPPAEATSNSDANSDGETDALGSGARQSENVATAIPSQVVPEVPQVSETNSIQ